MSIATKLRSAVKLLYAPSPIHNFKVKIAENLRAAYVHLKGPASFRFRFAHLFPYVVVPSIPETVELYLRGQGYERTEATIIYRWLSRADFAVDCGANVGLMSSLMAEAVGSGGLVCAIEAAPSTATKLRVVLKDLGLSQVVLVEKALCDCTAHVYFTNDSSRSDANFIVTPEAATSNVCQVHAVTMDQVLATAAREPALVKLDIEGTEPLAFRGWKSLSETSHPPLLVFEVYPRGLARQSFAPTDIFDAIPLNRYLFWHLNTSWPNESPQFPRGIPFRLQDPYSHGWPMHSNVIAVPIDGKYADRLARLRGLLPAL